MRSKLNSLLSQLLLFGKDLITPDRVANRTAGEFVKGINLAGDSVMIEGNRWDSYNSALNSGLSVPGAQTITTQTIPQPYANKETRRMLNTAICSPHTLEITQTLFNGSYDIYLWIMENYQSDWHALEICIGDHAIANDVGKLRFAGWARYGAYSTMVTDGALRLTISTNDPNIDAHVMGISIFKSAASG